VDSTNLIVGAGVAYVGGTLVWHRMRIARSQRHGLELSLLRRVDATRVPPQAAAALDAYAQAEVARMQGDAPARERFALAARSAIRKAGGARSGPGLAHLDAQVCLGHLCGTLSLEWVAVGALWSITRAVRRFDPAPELHLSLAHAHAILGRSTEALDELARAVYYAHGARFYVDLVLASQFVEQARPRLRQSCL